jgi:hypothetical protein
LLAGAELYGIPGVLVALPTMAAGRAIWEFFHERIAFEEWDVAGVVPVEVEIEASAQAAEPVADEPSGSQQLL